MKLTNMVTGTAIAIVAAAAILAGVVLEPPSMDSQESRDSGQAAQIGR
jgi:hypothetical protein